MTELKTAILEYVRTNDYVSFAELARVLTEQGFEPAGNMAAEVAENCLLWAGMSAEFVDAVRDLLASGAVKLAPASLLLYSIDGRFLMLPIAKRPRPYKRLRWLPVTLRPGEVKGYAEK